MFIRADPEFAFVAAERTLAGQTVLPAPDTKRFLANGCHHRGPRAAHQPDNLTGCHEGYAPHAHVRACGPRPRHERGCAPGLRAARAHGSRRADLMLISEMMMMMVMNDKDDDDDHQQHQDG